MKIGDQHLSCVVIGLGKIRGDGQNETVADIDGSWWSQNRNLGAGRPSIHLELRRFSSTIGPAMDSSDVLFKIGGSLYFYTFNLTFLYL